MNTDATGVLTGPATHSPETGTPGLELDGDAFIRAWHTEHVHKVDGGDPECVLCGPLRSTYQLPTCRCGASLHGEGCDCEQDTGDTDALFASPILWDLTGRAAA